MMMKSTFPFAALIAAGFGFSACHRQTPEELLREWVREAGVRIEKRDVRGLLDRLDPAYVDSTGRSREETGKMLEAYFAKFSGIVVHVLSSRSELVSTGSAAIEADVAVSSGGAEALRRLIRFSGECYRFRGRLQRSGSGWRAVYAEWEAIERENLFPDSVEMLRKIFPRL
jgi:hypothetical protein